ncbi:MAG: FHA domain-containing protein [Proteobacteria bacterium]|nr:FHA domain-containing protein [Pseudomonadota bacterium]
MPNLYVVTNDGQIFNFPISKDKVSIGRSNDNDLILADNAVSRYHTEIQKRKNDYILADLGSYNGTKLNGKSIQKVFLKHGDKIQIGSSKLTFLINGNSLDQAEDSVVLTVESDSAVDRQIVRSSPLERHGQSQELLVSSEDKNEEKRGKSDFALKKERFNSQEYLAELARNNKVLFVLYEISRHLNQIHDFNELLRKIMDLIFMVIDADYGFLVLAGGPNGDNLIPVVVKHKTEHGKSKREIKASRTLIDKVINGKVALLISNAMTDSRLDGAKSAMIQQIRSAICVPLWREDKIIGVIQLDSVRIDNQFNQNDLELLKAIGSQAAMVIEQSALNERIREEERMRNRLQRFHSPQVIEMILKGGEETIDEIMESKELIATILFADIVGFTRLSETMPPREINIILNRYFSRMTDIVFSHGGTLDKYIGDGLMAVFGAPMEKEDDAERAVRTALEIRRQLTAMMKTTSADRRFDIRVGLNTGRVVAGNIGSPKRMEYTVIGDPVNVASRLESIAKPNQIIIGEETFGLVKNKFKIQEIGTRKVKGKSSGIMVYEVLE